MEHSPKSLLNSIVFQHESAPTITVSNLALRRMKKLAESSKSSETGGILVGHNLGRDIQITEASDPGPNANCSSTHFLRDTVHCREFLDRCYKISGADYVGEWHSHVVSLRHLSRGDINTLVGILIDPDYDFVAFAVVLVVLRKGKSELLVYVAERLTDASHKRIAVTELYRGKFPEGSGNDDR
jgi:integrative and conjugative element protein (TIGR02256 family)